MNMRESFRDFLIARGQTFPNDAREIRVLVCGASTFVDQAAPFQFGEGQSAGGDGVILIKHFVGFSVKENAPSPWSTEFNRALSANACGAIACNSVVPTRIFMQGVDRGYVFAKSLARLRRRSQRVVKINIFPAIIGA